MSWSVSDRWMMGTRDTLASFALLDTAMHEARKLSRRMEAALFVWQFDAKGKHLVKAIAKAGRCVYVEPCHCGTAKSGCGFCDGSGFKEAT